MGTLMRRMVRWWSEIKFWNGPIMRGGSMVEDSCRSRARRGRSREGPGGELKVWQMTVWRLGWIWCRALFFSGPA